MSGTRRPGGTLGVPLLETVGATDLRPAHAPAEDPRGSFSSAARRFLPMEPLPLPRALPAGAQPAHQRPPARPGQVADRCPCCGEALEGLADVPSYRACPGCDSLVSQVPEGEYQEGYYFHDRDDDRRARSRARLQLEHLRRLFGRAGELGADLPRTARVLELGCGKGSFVEAAVAEDWDLWGLDVSRPAIAAAAERGLEQRCRLGHALDQAPEGWATRFDAVVAFELLEHFDQPQELLSAARRYLRPGGWLLGSTPNVSSHWRQLLGADWHGYGIPQYHRVYLGERALERLADRMGVGPVWTESLCEHDESRLLLRNRARSVARRLGHDHWLGHRLAALCVLWSQRRAERAAGSPGGPAGDTLLYAIQLG